MYHNDSLYTKMYQGLRLYMKDKIRRSLAMTTVLAGFGVSGWAITSMMTGHLHFDPLLYLICCVNMCTGLLLVTLYGS